MRKTQHAVHGAIAALASAALISGCAAAAGGGASGTATSASAGQSSSGATVVIGTSATPATLDPEIASDVQTDFTDAAMYDTLVNYNASGQIVPELATSWSYNADATEVTLTLRSGVKFHSGDPFTAADVVFTLDRIASLNTGVASFLTAYKSSAAVGTYKVVISLNQTDTTFVGALSEALILDSKLVKQHEGSDSAQSWLASHDAGSGPYTLTSYTPNEQATFKRFSGYWDYNAARPAVLEYEYISSSTTLSEDLKAGQINIASGLSPSALSEFKNNPGFNVLSLPSLVQRYAVMNNQAPPLNNIKVREAIQLAYDYSGDIEAVADGQGTQATGLVAPGVACRVDSGPVTQNVAEAKQLIKEAGATGDTLTLVYQSIPEHVAAATLLASDLEAIGLKVQLKTVTYPQYTSMITSASTTPDLAILWDFPYYPEIGPMLYRVYDSKFINQTNYSRYSNATVDSLLQQGMDTTNSAQACSDFEAAQRQIIADHVIVNMTDESVPIVTTSNITGISYLPTFQVFDPAQITVG